MVILLVVPVILSTSIWPLNRWVERGGGRNEVYGFWISLFGALTAGLLSLVLGQSFANRALQAYPSAIVFPVTVLGPLIAVLLLSGLVFRERLSRLTWAACLAGVAGLALLSLRPG